MQASKRLDLGCGTPRAEVPAEPSARTQLDLGATDQGSRAVLAPSPALDAACHTDLPPRIDGVSRRAPSAPDTRSVLRARPLLATGGGSTQTVRCFGDALRRASPTAACIGPSPATGAETERLLPLPPAQAPAVRLPTPGRSGRTTDFPALTWQPRPAAALPRAICLRARRSAADWRLTKLLWRAAAPKSGVQPSLQLLHSLLAAVHSPAPQFLALILRQLAPGGSGTALLRVTVVFALQNLCIVGRSSVGSHVSGGCRFLSGKLPVGWREGRKEGKETG